MKSFNGKLFGDKVKELRGKMSQYEFAEIHGINRATLSLIERAKQLPSLEFFVKCCNEMKVDTTTFFDETSQNGLIYLMGHLDNPQEISNLSEIIKLREKYYALNKRCRSK